MPWKPTRRNGIYDLKPGQAMWVRFTAPPTQGSERWLLEIPYPALDRASLYTLNAADQWIEQRTGDLTPVNQWLAPHRFPLMVLASNRTEPASYLLRIENAQGFSAPIRFVKATHLFRSEQQVSLFLGFYFGMAFLGCVIGLLGVLWLRDRAYLYYGLCSALVGLTLAVMTGVAALHLWPNSANWADRSLAVLGICMLISVLLLNATVVSLAERSRVLNLVVWAAAIAGLLLTIALGVTDSALRLPLAMPYVVLVPTLVLGINLWAWRHGDRFGGWLLLSSLPFAISWAMATMRYAQWIPLSFATEQGGLASMALELPAMLAVLIMRSQQRRENKRRIEGLDRMDPATGLINEHVFVERLTQMIARSERLKNQSAVMLIDIVNTDQTQRDFGRKIADELPLRVAARLLSTAREIDSAARLSERRFGMLIEGPFTAEDAATLGPRIVARCLMPYQGLHVDCVAQVRVAYALVPYQAASTDDLLSQLEARLAAASSEDKRAVFVLGEPAPQARRSRPRKNITASVG
ncbi:MAG: 7TM diverse intracellular signaling domain-containing protein [Polaromonas sp.]